MIKAESGVSSSPNQILDYLLSKGVAAKVQASDDPQELRLQLKILARPGSKMEKIQVMQSGEIKISFKERPVDGAANQALLEILSRALGPAPSHIHLLRGQSQKAKQFLIIYHFRPQKDVFYYLQMLRSFLD